MARSKGWRRLNEEKLQDLEVTGAKSWRALYAENVNRMAMNVLVTGLSAIILFIHLRKQAQESCQDINIKF